MTSFSGIQTSSSFVLNSALPVDRKTKCTNLTERNNLSITQRWLNMLVEVDSENKRYKLINEPGTLATTNSDWADFGINDFYIPEQNIVTIEPTLAEIVGRRYQSIQNALTFTATKNPTASNRWGIKVCGTNLENFNLAAYVSILGEFNTTRLTGVINGGTFVTDQYAFLIKDCILYAPNINSGSIIFTYNCIVNGMTSSTGALYIQDGGIINGGNFLGCTTQCAILRASIIGTTATPITFPSVFQASFSSLSSSNANGIILEGVKISNCTIGKINYFILNAGTYNIKNTTISNSFTIPIGVIMNLHNVSGEANVITISTGATLNGYCINNMIITNSGGTWNNKDGVYNPIPSKLTATNIQAAIDEINSSGPILLSTDSTRHRISLVDDGLGNYNLDIGPTL